MPKTPGFTQAFVLDAVVCSITLFGRLVVAVDNNFRPFRWPSFPITVDDATGIKYVRRLVKARTKNDATALSLFAFCNQN